MSEDLRIQKNELEINDEILENNDDINIEDDDIIEDDNNDDITNTINDDDEVESDLDVYFRYNTNNHKLDGKHSLKRDTILNGKLLDNETKDSYYSQMSVEFDIYDTGSIPIEKGSIFEEESKNAENYQSKKKLSEDVYNLLKDNTDLDFKSNRRKPNKITFNNYYKMLLKNIDSQYTKSEIFVELSYYFTDNIFNMYKLLDKKYATIIIMELKNKGFLNNLNSINFM